MLSARLAVAALLSPSLAVDELYSWEAPPAGEYYDEADLPGDASSCCGSQLIGDPAYGVDAQICECDATAGECDPACCCDQDCSEFETMTVFQCENNEPYTARAGVNMCSDQLVRANLPQSAVAEGWDTVTDLDGILCVVADNSASFGAFLSDPTSASGALSEEEVIAELDRYGVDSYADCVLEGRAYCEEPASGLTYTSSEAHYSYAEPLMGDGCLAAGADTACSNEAEVLMPAASPDGACGGRQQALAFLVDVPPFSCSLAVDTGTLAEACATRLNASFLRQQAFAESPAAAASLAPAILRRVGAPDAALPNFTAIADAPASAYDAATHTCSDALVSLQYQLTVTAATGKLSSVAAYLDLAEVSATAGQTLHVSTSYAAAFVDAAADSGTRAISGRPGYVRGRPVLVADGSTNLQLRRDGLKLLGAGPTGECDADAGGASLLFGEALDASCTYTMDYTALNAFCTDTGYTADFTTLPLLAGLELDWASSSAVALVGAYGDAHPAAIDDWVELTLQQPSAGLTMSWDAANQQCNNVLSGIHVQLLTADVGAVLMPVRKVIGAHLVLTSQTVRPRRCALGVPCDTRVVVRATTEFVDLPEDGRTFDYVPPMPTIIPALPDDIFYPFYLHDDGADATSAASARRASGALWSLLLCAGVTAATLAAADRRR